MKPIAVSCPAMLLAAGLWLLSGHVIAGTGIGLMLALVGGVHLWLFLQPQGR
jgi:hypothetical protein